MEINSIYNILMYSHDTYGLGHIRRTMAIAASLKGCDINILIITGSPIAGRFSFPKQIDFVRIPGMIKSSNEQYNPLSIKIDPSQALNIRKNIITTTVKTFLPDLFIVDKEPLGLKKEILPALKWIKKKMPGTRIILGLRDIMDDAVVIRENWKRKKIYQTIENFYNEIWVYGKKEFYDSAAEYAIPEAIEQKMIFTGYIPRKIPDKLSLNMVKKELQLNSKYKLIVVTAGGGGDGFEIFDTFLSMLEIKPFPNIFSILITGPLMPDSYKKNIFERSEKLGIQSFSFYSKMEELFKAADIVISMGGYNTLCEVISQQTMSLIIPRETPRLEQLLRARIFHKNNMADYMPWSDLSVHNLYQKITSLFKNSRRFEKQLASFQMTGLDVIKKRIEFFKNEYKK